MCRWLAYSGVPVCMDTLLFQPHNSLIRQSLSAQRSIVPTNGDGFGLGWYADLPHPGLFRDTMPAWNDSNLPGWSKTFSRAIFLGWPIQLETVVCNIVIIPSFGLERPLRRCMAQNPQLTDKLDRDSPCDLDLVA